MTVVARIGGEATLEQLDAAWRSAFMQAQAQPNMTRMIRAVDLWRMYERKLNERFPAPEPGRPAA